MERQKSVVQIYCVALLLLSGVFVPCLEARKVGGGSRTRGGGSSSRVSNSGRVQKPSQSQQNSHASLASLSYAGYNSQPNRPKQPSAPHPPAAPAAPQQPIGWNVNNNANAASNQKPIGWNVNQNQNANQQSVPKQNVPTNNAAPPPYSPQSNPPSYSQHPNNGPPSPYSVNNNPNAGNTGFRDSPPAYQPNPGYPQQPHYNQQPHYPQQQPGFGQNNYQPQPGYNQNGFPHQSGYPQQGNFGGNYPMGGHGYPNGGGFGNQPVVNNYYSQSSGGSGLTNALLLGVGGIALYGALKPGETKTIYINNSTNPADAREATNNGTHILLSGDGTTVATPLAPFPVDCSIYRNVTLPPTMAPQAATNLTQVPTEVVPATTTTALPMQNVTDASPVETTANGDTTTVADTTMMNGTEMAVTTTMMKANESDSSMTTPTPLAPMPSAQIPLAPMPSDTMPAQNAPTTPQIPQECMPFVTGQVPWPEVPTPSQQFNNQPPQNQQNQGFQQGSTLYPTQNWSKNDDYLNNNKVSSLESSGPNSGSDKLQVGAILSIALAAILARI